jgi:hypothetical protein
MIGEVWSEQDEVQLLALGKDSPSQDQPIHLQLLNLWVSLLGWCCQGVSTMAGAVLVLPLLL